MMTDNLKENARVAADLAAAGFAVFPCHSGGDNAKRPMPGVFWRSASTSDRVKVEGWWRRWPDAAVGLDLAKSRLVVIDADRHDEDADGVAAIGKLMHDHQFDPNAVPVVATPNQGTHFYFRQPDGAELGNGRGDLPAGIDVRGSGGYVIAPGTIMQDGRLYEVFGQIADAPVLPGWLQTLISAPKAKPVIAPVPVPSGDRPSDDRVRAYVDRALEFELDAVRSAPKGQRNHQLNASAFSLGQLVGAGWVTQAEVSAMLENAAQGLAQDDGLPSVRKTIRSGLAAGAREPRQMPADDRPVPTAEDYAISARLQVGTATVIDADTGEILDDEEVEGVGAVDTMDLPDSLLQPGGVVGELADWICEWTAEPIRIHAVGSALTIVGTLLGRKVYSQTRPSCTALYIGAVAPSGMGKQHPQDCIRLALDEVVGNGALHMGWNVSLPAIASALTHQASKIMVADEFADKLIGIRSKNATTSQSAISEGLRTLWGINTGTYSPDVSMSRGDVKIMRPTLSFYGASTIKDFTRSLISKDVTNGLFNRFLILPRYSAVDRGEERDGIMTLPPDLKDKLQWLYNCLPGIQMTLAARGDGHPSEPILVPFTDAAAAMNEANKDFQRKVMIESDQDDALALYGRYAEQIKRVATIVAVGRIPAEPSRAEITDQDMVFAETLVRFSIDQFVLMVRRDMAENWVEANRQKVLGVIRSAKGRYIKNRDLKRKIRSIPTREFDGILAILKEAECIEEVEITTDGRTARGYRFLHD